MSMSRFDKKSTVPEPHLVRPVIPDFGNTTVQLKASDEDGGYKGHKPTRVYGFDDEGFALIMGKRGTDAEGRLVRAVDHPDYLSIAARKHASERERQVEATPGWFAQIVDIPADASARKLGWDLKVGDRFPVILWRYLGPADVRPVVPRPAEYSDGTPLNQRGFCLSEFGIIYRLIAPGEGD